MLERYCNVGFRLRHLSGTFRSIACVYACAPRPTHNMIPDSSHIWGDVNKGYSLYGIQFDGPVAECATYKDNTNGDNKKGAPCVFGAGCALCVAPLAWYQPLGGDVEVFGVVDPYAVTDGYTV